jgi:endoglycosylceramidase
MIFFEPSVLTGPLATPGPIPGLATGDDLVYAPHLYNGSISPLPGTIADGFANAATAARSYGTPFFSGEWGWFGDPAADAPKIATYAALEDAYRVGGTWWQWKQACGDPHAIGVRGARPSCESSGAPYSDGLVTRPPSNTSILSRAYPRAAPGVLQQLDADVASGSLTITGDADRPAVDADLWVPARCTTPSVTGSNVGPSAIRAVDGGWRVTVTVPSPGPYSISVACGLLDGIGGSATNSIPRTDGGGTDGDGLPATGRGDGLWLPAALLGLALAVRAGGRGVHRSRARAGTDRRAGATRGR